MKIIIAGGTGFLGQVLSNHFANHNHEAIILTRSPGLVKLPARGVLWDAKTFGSWSEELEHADVLINLTGKNVNCRYTDQNKKDILHSRLDSVSVLGKAIEKCIVPPKLWINAASATIYRHAEDRDMDEHTGEIGSGFSVDVCRQWEDSFNNIKLPNTRKVILRMAIVLGKNDGAYTRLRNMVKAGLGGQQGNGRQYFSWIHEEDLCRMIDFCIENINISGVYNCAAPDPRPNSEFMYMLRKSLHITFGIPSPVWLLKIGAWLIGTETELILKSRRVVPKKILEAGFHFKFAKLEEALDQLRMKN